MLWLLLVVGAAFLAWYALIRPLSYWTRLGVKQTKPWILVGDNWVSVFRIKSFLDFMKDIYEQFPDSRYVGLYQFSTPTLMIRDPELIKQITVKDFDHFTDHRIFFNPESDKLFAKNLFSLKGNTWRDMRITLSPSFTSSKMKFVFGTISEAAENFVNFFEIKDCDNVMELDMKDMFTRFANDVIASTAFGLQVDSLKEPNNEFYLMGKRMTNFSRIDMVIKFFGMMMVPNLFKALKIGLFRKEETDFFTNIISDAIKMRKEQKIVRPDMLNLLLGTRKCIEEEDKVNIDTGFATVQESELGNNQISGAPKAKHHVNLTDLEITAQALIFFFAGFETISTVMCFTVYELACHPDTQTRLRDEIKNTMEECQGKLTYESLLKMKYLDMVTTEALRKWPPTGGLDRVCTKNYTIEPVNADEKPLQLKKGTVILIPSIGIHMDPAYYSNPEVFDPERFSDENKDDVKPYTYLPFGTGPRNCIGSRFALLELKCVLFHLLSKFEVVPTEKTQIPMKLSAKAINMIPEKGFWLGFKYIQK